MARFNKTKVPQMTTSYEGGYVYEKDLLGEWVNMLFSDFLENGFYECADDRRARFINLTEQIIDKYGVEFAAKAAFFARNEFGMRSISQQVAAIINKYQFENKRKFYNAFPFRPDDVAEVFAAIDDLGDKRSHACVRGFGDYLSTLNEYNIGKYKLNSRNYNMYDCINITHAHSDVIDKYKAGNLKAPDTWEVNISTAKDQAERDYHWKKMVEEGRLGYLALLRNLRNIVNAEGVTNAWLEEYLVPAIANEKGISLVFPYQIYAAYKNIGIRNHKIDAALNDAFIAAVKNMPELSGTSCIILDISGSMESPISANSKISIKEAGAVYAASILIQNPQCDFIKFGTYAKRMNFNVLDNVFDIIDRMVAEDRCGHGTNINEAFDLLNKHYDRIFLISDMQIMDESGYWWSYNDRRFPQDVYKDYCRKHGQAKLYSFDLGNYHTRVGNPNNPNVYYCTALNEKVFKFIALLENGDSLFDYINQTNAY